MSAPTVVARMRVHEANARQVNVPEDSPLRETHGEKVVGGQVLLRCDYDEQNQSWAFYTPSGEVSMSIDNPEAFKAFVPGQEFLVTFTPV